MPDRPGGRVNLEDLFQNFDEARLRGIMENPPSEGDREMFRWPIIATKVPAEPIDAEVQARIDEEIAASTLAVKVAMGRTGLETPDDDDFRDPDICFAALTDILLKHATSPEQVTRLTQAYIQTQMQIAMRGQMQVLVIGGGEVVTDTLDIEARIVEDNPARWDTITKCARIPEWIVFRYALETRAFERYALESGHDGVFTLLADPSEVYILGFDPEAEGREIPKCARIIPEEKRMTTAKLARFFQLPGLQDLIEEDAYGDSPAAYGSNLAVLAEYFCENDDVVFKNHVNAEDIKAWLEAKFEAHPPPLDVAWYIWGRLQHTRFESASPVIEQYILDQLEEESPWLFELAMIPRSQCREAGGVFRVYRYALMGAKLSIVPEDRAKYNDLMASLPSMYILQTVLASQVYARNEDAEYMIAHYSDHPTDFAPEYASVHDLDLNTASFDMVRDLFLEDFEPASYEWTQIKGFELLDPIEVFKNSTRNRHEAVARLFGVVTKKLSEVTDARIFEKFKIEVIDKIDPVVGRLILEAMKKCALPVAAEALFKKHDSDTIVAVARGEELPAEKSDIIMPGDVAWSELFGEPFKAERISIAAERELLSRHLQGARGADEITRYLMGHVDTMRPSEVVRPQPDAPHDWIIAEFGSSPDLLGLLDLATLLTYLGYDSDQIKTEIALQAELADSFARPELAQIGVESEMVSEAPEGRIVNPEPFAWMFNVLPQDPKDKPVNEVMTAPSSSPVMQAMILSTMTDERFGFVDTHRLWEQTARTDRSPNSLHLNVSIPSTLPFTPDLIDGYMGELQRVQWLAYGGDKTQRSIARGRVSPWQTGSLLDVMGSAHQRTKAEIRNLRLEKDGSHITRIGQLQLLASACIQYMMERAGLTMTPSGRIMSAAYHEFQAEAKQLSGTEEALAIRATELIERYSTHIASELKTGEVKKKTGIIVTPN